MNIGAAAKISGLTTKAIRYYEELGLLTGVARMENGYRDYDDRNINDLVFIRRARVTGFDLDETRRLLSLLHQPERHSREVKELVLDKLQQVEEQLEHLMEMKRSLGDLATMCAGDEQSQCAIIDSLSQPERSAK